MSALYFSTCWLNGNGFVALIAFCITPVSNAIKRFYAFLAGVAILWSVGVAGRHVWLQHLPPDQVPSCGRV